MFAWRARCRRLHQPNRQITSDVTDSNVGAVRSERLDHTFDLRSDRELDDECVVLLRGVDRRRRGKRPARWCSGQLSAGRPWDGACRCPRGRPWCRSRCWPCHRSRQCPWNRSRHRCRFVRHTTLWRCVVLGPYGKSINEDPANVRHGLATDETTLIEQPGVLVVKLLIAVVGNDGCVHLVGNHQHETVSTTNRTRRWCYQFTVSNRF